MNADRSAYLFEDMSPEIPRKAYFPSVVAGMPRAFFGQSIGAGGNDYVSNTPFHAEQMADARKRVADRFHMNGYNNRIYSIGGARNMVPKPQPQGSFAMPLNLNGNQTYPVAGIIRGGGGSFRTDAGAAYGQQLLRQRAEQLRQLQDVVEQGADVPAVPTPSAAPALEPDEADEIAFSLLLDDLQSTVQASAAQSGSYERPRLPFLFSGLTADEFRRLFGLARKILLDLSRDKLTDYIDKLGDLLDTYERAIQSSEIPQLAEIGVGEVDLQGVTIARGTALKRLLPLYKTLALLKFGVASLNLQPKARKLAMKAAVREIVKQRSDEGLDRILNRMYEVLQDRLDADADAAFQEEQEDNEEDDEQEGASGIGAAEAASEDQSAAGMSGVSGVSGPIEPESDQGIANAANMLSAEVMFFQNDFSDVEQGLMADLAFLLSDIEQSPARVRGNQTILRALRTAGRRLQRAAQQNQGSADVIIGLEGIMDGVDNLIRLVSAAPTGSGYGKRGGYGASYYGKRGGSKAQRVIGGAMCGNGKGRKKGGAMNELDMKIEQVSKMNDKARKTHQQGLAFGKTGRTTTKSYSSERRNTGMNDQRFDRRKGSNVSMVITQ